MPNIAPQFHDVFNGNTGLWYKLETDIRHLVDNGWKAGLGREDARNRISKFSPDVFCAAADAILATPNMMGRLHEVEVPTWVVAGENDAGPMAFNSSCEAAMPNC